MRPKSCLLMFLNIVRLPMKDTHTLAPNQRPNAAMWVKLDRFPGMRTDERAAVTMARASAVARSCIEKVPQKIHTRFEEKIHFMVVGTCIIQVVETTELSPVLY